MKINDFFTETLGAKPRNPRWSWGAFDPMTNRVFLRVWADQMDQVGKVDRILVATDVPRRHSAGFAERHDHLAQVRNGAEAYGIVCTAVDPATREARRIASFDESKVLRLGNIAKKGGRTYAEIVARVPVESITRQRTAESTLTSDLNTLLKRRIDSTTRDALVGARVGQGLFRSQVLQLWDNRCSVTRSTILDAIRASHIKPWRAATDEERLDPYNGLPLVASLDALFDAGLISFEASGALIVASSLSDIERRIFGVQSRSLARAPSQKTLEYLAYHRNHVFRDET